MEVVQLANELFNGREVRIFGTKEEPLFVADDIGALLGIKKIRNTIGDFDDSEKKLGNIKNYHTYNGGGDSGIKKLHAHNIGGEGYTREMTLLTEEGLYKVLFTSRKKEARDFQKWVCRVLKEIRLKGYYNLNEDIEKQALQKELENKNITIAELEQKTKELAGVYKPLITYHEYDINEFTDEPCVYLISLTETDFKFGVSGEIDCRSSSHFSKFRKLGLDPKIIKLWKCKTMKIMKDTESKIKLFAKHNNILANKYDQKEIITTDNIEPIVENITKYINDQNFRENSAIEIKKMELEIRKLELENESKRLDIELKRLNTTNNIATVVNAVDDHPEDNIADDDEPLVVAEPVEVQPMITLVHPIIQGNNKQLDYERRRALAVQWIRENSPVGINAKPYYEMYLASNAGKKLNRITIQQFKALVISLGYVAGRGKGNVGLWEAPDT